MEFGPQVGRYSKDTIKDVELKQKKMQVGKKLLIMLAKHSRSQLFDASPRQVKGFKYFKMREPRS
jgi:uncharacterized Rossmann fold enzyme